MSFSVTLSTVLVMLAYAVPGWLLVKFKKIPKSAISAFATFLLYVCSPMQAIYAMQATEYSPYMLKYLGLSLVISALSMSLMLAVVYFFLRRRQSDVPYRICVVASSMGNVGFMGLPLIQALLPDYPQMQVFLTMFILTLNLVMWSLGSWITTRDRRYLSAKRVLLNPGCIAIVIGLALFFGRVRITGQAGSMVELLGRMSTPVCMLILGMRLATVPLASVFTARLPYLSSALKLIVFPLATLALCSLLPVERDFIRGIFILSCMPSGNLVLSFAEMLGEGQREAANTVLLCTMLSMITIPLMLLLI